MKVPTSKRKRGVESSVERPATRRASLAITSDRDAKALVESRGSATALDESETAKDRDATALLKRNSVDEEAGDGENVQRTERLQSYIKKDICV